MHVARALWDEGVESTLASLSRGEGAVTRVRPDGRTTKAAPQRQTQAGTFSRRIGRGSSLLGWKVLGR